MNRTTNATDRDRLLELLMAAERKRRKTTHQGIVRQARGMRIPLSFAQERLWFLNRIGAGAAYNLAVALKLSGDLKVAALEQSFRELVRRHETLRTRFDMEDGVPCQIIDESASIELQQVDLSGVTDHELQRAKLRDLTQRERSYPFDLSKGPLLRTVLIDMGQREHVLLMTMHHIVSDGWSFTVLKQELSALYAAYCRGQPSPLPELPVQYVDYAVWQRQRSREDLLHEQLQYWTKQLAGAPPSLELPTDRPRPAAESFKGAMMSFSVPAGLTRALQKLANGEAATLFMVLLAAYQVLLARWSGQQDILVGVPIAGRTHSELEGLIGFFINTLVLRTELSGEPTFRQLLARVKETTLQAYAHQDLPFEVLVKELRPERDLARQPVFQVTMSLQNYPEEKLELPGVTWTRANTEAASAHFDLMLLLQETDTGLNGIFEYATDLFDDTTIQRMAEQFRTLLGSVVANPDRAIQRLPLLGEEERRLLARWNEPMPGRAITELVHEMFERNALRTPNAVAVTYKSQSLTYAELDRRANQLASYLTRKGVGLDGLVAICVERSLEMAVALLATLKAGAGYLPLDPTYPSDRLDYMLRDSSPVLLLTQERLRRILPRSEIPTIALDVELNAVCCDVDSGRPQRRPEITADHLAYVIYTSGSTGNPKGVMVTHGNLTNLIQWFCQAFAVRAEDRCSSVAASGFDAAVMEFWPPLSVGATVALAPAAGDAESLLSWWTRERLDVSFLPTPLAEVVISQGMSNSQLRWLLTGGDRLRLHPGADSFALSNNYGPTECTVVATSGTISSDEPTLHIGRPIAGTQIYILDAYGQQVPIGAVGEIYIGGVSVARGYWNRPQLTAERFIADPFCTGRVGRLYKTGDLARWRAEGVIEYVGRNDQQVKIRGFRIELGEIEQQLRRHPAVREAVVVAREDVPGAKRLVAYIIPNNPCEIEESIRIHLRAILPPYMVPSAFVVLERFPLTPNGKLDSRALPVPEMQVDGGEQVEPPQGPLENALAEIWGELLHVASISRQANFFELGGHSLLGIKLIAKVAQRFDVALPATAIFQYSNIQSMAEAIAARRVEQNTFEATGQLETESGVL